MDVLGQFSRTHRTKAASAQGRQNRGVRVRTLLTQLNRRVHAAPSPGAQWVENFGSWFPRMTRLSTPASEMLASRITPPLEPSLSMARDRAEGRTDTRSLNRVTGRGLQLPACLAAAAFTCRGEVHTLVFAQSRFVVGVHEAIDVAAAAAAHRHRLPHQHPTNRNAVHLRGRRGRRVSRRKAVCHQQASN